MRISDRLVNALFLVSLAFLYACHYDPAESEFREAEGLSGRGSFKEAIERYSYVVNRYPESRWAPEAQLKIARVYNLRLNDPEKAVYAYSALFFMYPGSPEALQGREELAGLHSRKGEHRKALEEYQRLFEAIPGKKQRYQYLIAMEYLYMGDFNQARVELMELNNIVASPNLSPRIRLHIADTYYVEGLNKDALRSYDEIIRRFPHSAAAVEARLKKSRIYEEQGDLARALDALRGMDESADPSIAARLERLASAIKAGKERR